MKATYRPSAETDETDVLATGPVSRSWSPPLGSTLTCSVVADWRSRRKTSTGRSVLGRPPNDTNRPSAEIDGWKQSPKNPV
jgi:ribosomal protein L34